MPKLTDAIVKSARFEHSLLKIRDGNGLYLHVMSSGKYWRYDYRFNGKRKTLSMGVYPDVSLKSARIELYNAKALLDRGVDPSYDKQLKKEIGGDHSLESIYRQWLAVQSWSPGHFRTMTLRCEKDLIPRIGHMPIQQITAADVLGVLRIIESRGNIETAHRVKTAASQMMRYAIAAGLISSDPCRDLAGALKTVKPKPMAAITDESDFGKLLRLIDTYDHSPIVASALQLLPHVALRPGELRFAEWTEIDLPGRLWEIPGNRMKMRRDHFVPLTDSTVQILERIQELTGGHALVFPSLRATARPISENTLAAALKYLGIPGDKHVPHGFRSSFSTMAYESEFFDGDVIEMQLAHAERNAVKGAYKRGTHLNQRRKLMDWWSTKIETLKTLQ